MRVFSLPALLCLALAWTAPADAGAQDLAGCKASEMLQSLDLTRIQDGAIVLTGKGNRPVQLDCDDMQFFADQMEIYNKEDRIVARGNIVFVSATNRISAERMEFNTKSRTGTFYVASGTATLRANADPSMFGAQEPDAYFYGDELHKLGPRKYKIERGGFTTCVQPTPRWELVSGSITVNLDDYVLLTNSLFKVKGVPLMYLPAFYYPIQEDDRATGFLIPTYGASTIRGQTFSNAFFWAIGRSHDATFFHDWYSKTGQGYGSEYRYVLGGGGRGNARGWVIDERATTFTNASGGTQTSDAKKSYEVRGDLTQPLPGGLRARANADYTSSIVTRQRYQQNIYAATNTTRRFGGNISGNWSEYSLSATLDRNDVFYNENDMTTNAAMPRVTLSRGERPIGRLPIYFGATSEFVTLERSTTRGETKVQDQGLTRLDIVPTLRVPFTRWPFFTVNSVVTWRNTYWTESLDAQGVQVPETVGRRYFDFQTRITGPVFNRIWTTAGNGYADKFKHVIEPSLSVQRVSAIDNFNRIVPLESHVDQIVGSMTRYRYGVANRLYAKKEAAREILTAELSQSYYTDARAAQYDRAYQSTAGATKSTHFSPVVLQLRGAPTDRIQAEFRTEWDPTAHALRTLAANGTFGLGSWLDVTGGWSQRRYIPTLAGFNNPASANNYLRATASLRKPGNRVGGTFSFDYDLKNDNFLQQRWVAYYNAQCCGIGFEYQTFNLQGSLAGVPYPQDRRFNISFTLAGIGTFSNLLGAFGGQER